MAPTTYDPNSPDEQAVPLPSASRIELTRNIILQPPLTRRGHGPGLIVFLPAHVEGPHESRPKSLDPEPVQKWAEEGFAVVGVTCHGQEDVISALQTGKEALVGLKEVDIKDKLGVLVYDSKILPKVLNDVSSDDIFACIVSYGGYNSDSALPLLCHVPNPGIDLEIRSDKITCHKYLNQGEYFVLPQSKDYHGGSASVAHSRSLVFLRKHIGGPLFDLEAIWEEHTYYEFEVRSLAKTMGTMVAEPYVNHVPTMTGGMGRKELTAFYRDHFIFVNPADTAIEPVSRTVGADRIIDEFIFTMTHDKVVDYLLPGIPPSGKKLRIPAISVVNVRGDRLYHEHIWWDQATALRQAGVLPDYLPYPYPSGNSMLRLPVAGEEAARLLVDEMDGKSNEMMGPEWGLKTM